MAAYFFDAASVGLVKIGYATHHVRLRLSSCQVGSPVPLTLAAVDVDGDRLTEAELHWRFRAFRSHGDWFRKVAGLQAVIDETAETGCVPDGYYAPDAQPLTYGEVRSRFGLTMQDMRSCRPAIRMASLVPSDLVGDTAIPALVTLLKSRGVQVHHHDFFRISGKPHLTVVA